jgi:hypothetical protein
MILFSILGIGAIVLVGAISHTTKLHGTLAHKTAITHLPTAIQALILVAQASELVKVVEHVTIVNMSAALLLLTIIVATKSGTEGELH